MDIEEELIKAIVGEESKSRDRIVMDILLGRSSHYYTKSKSKIEDEQAEIEIHEERCPLCDTSGHLEFVIRCEGHGEYYPKIRCKITDTEFSGWYTEKETLERFHNRYNKREPML